MKILVLPQTDNPAWNLAAEEVLLRRLDISSGSYLFFYINKPCLVIGRNQNPIIEINLSEMDEQGISFYRRISGGGTGYHDPGNLNFTFITANTPQIFDNHGQLLQPILDYFSGLKINLEINARNDLLLNGKKISGNARFASRDRLLSHGTLLINTDLGQLRQYIRPMPPLEIETKASASRRSPVTVISAVKKNMTAQEVQSGLERYFKDKMYWTDFVVPLEWLAEIERLAGERFAQKDWKYGRSPQFTYRLPLFREGDAFSISADRKLLPQKRELQLEIDQFRLQRMKLTDFPERLPSVFDSIIGKFWDKKTAEILSNTLNNMDYIPFGNLNYNFGF